jgi:methylmalonyl-CoA/ethylmalonyl-CoA epimerase
MDTLKGKRTNGRKESRKDQLLGIDHIAIAVEDLEEAIRWYTDGLGFELVERRTTRGARTGMISAVVTTPGATLVLIQGTEPTSQVSRFIEKFGPGVQHIAFSVREIDVVMGRIGRVGAAPDTSIIAGSGIRQLFLRRDAGSGVRVELIERRGGTFSDQTVDRLFREFETKNLV